MTSRRKIFLFVALPLVIIAVATLFVANKKPKNDSSSSGDTTANSSALTAQSCDQILPPTDIAKATSVLYPGQVRGSDFKPHGGLRFDGLMNDDITVIAPITAKVASGSRYIEQGELQYMFQFESDCGLDYRFDHLRTLSPKLQAAADKLPEAKIDDSRTTEIKNVKVAAGETVATSVGFLKGDNGPNVGFDFGVYSQVQKNAAAADPAWVAAHQEDGDQAIYAMCWLDLLPSTDEATLRALPSNGAAGKTSDYCK